MLGLQQARIMIHVMRRFGCSGHAITLSSYGMAFSLRQLREVLEQDRLPIAITPRHVADWADGLASAVFFQLLGFERVTRLEYFDRLPGTVLFDLNSDDTPAELAGTADAVFDLGTSEHVFHTPNVFRHITNFARPGALVVHHTPANNHTNHGFYQFAPTLYRHYYMRNRFEVLAQYMNGFDDFKDDDQRLIPLDPEQSTKQFFLTENKRSMNLFVARKTEQSLCGAIPMQDVYARLQEQT